MFFGFLLSISVRIPLAIPISVPTSSMIINGNYKCNSTPCDQTTETYCGEKCWSKDPNTASFEYTFIGEMFEIYGKNNHGHGHYYIYLDGDIVATINQNQPEETERIVQYRSDVLPYGPHTIKAVGKGDKAFEIYKFTFWPSIYARRLNMTDMQGSWNSQSDNIGGYYEYTNSGDVTKTATIRCSKIWVYGAIDPNHGDVQFLADQQDFSFSETGDSRVNLTLLKETPLLDLNQHTISFKQKTPGKQILLNFIYYLPNTNFDTSYYINNSFSGDIDPTQIEPISEPFLFYNCKFTDITVAKDFYIHCINTVYIHNSTFENSQLLENHNRAAVMWFESTANNLYIYKCKFYRISCRNTGTGNVIHCNTIDGGHILIEKSEFLDCGRSQKALISLNHQDNSIKLYDCNFTFVERSSGDKVLNIKNNNAEIDGCRFEGCGADAIYLSEDGNDNPEGVFNFTNNYVASNKGKIIKAEKLRAKPNIINNTFENSDISNTYFISIIHNQQEIELINNTFSHMSSVDPQNAACGGLNLLIQSTFSEPTIKFQECKFYDIRNKRTNDYYSKGGALRFGSAEEGNNFHTHFEIIKCEFKRNKAQDHGGAICIRTSKNITISECIFEMNIANGDISNSKSLLADDNHGCGGAIYLITHFTQGNDVFDTESVNINNCNFIQNQAYEGFSIYLEYGCSCKNLNLINNTFNHDQSQQSSGINSNCNSGIVYINMNINNNHANENFEINSCNFINNQFNDVSNSFSNIQFFYPQLSFQLDLYIKNCIFEQSPFYQNNGALFIDNKFMFYVNSFNFINCTFRRNNGDQGGAISINFDKSFYFIDCYFTSNTANSGGAFSIINQKLCSIYNCKFIENTVTQKGGTIYITSYNNVQIMNCSFNNNKAGGGGGAINIEPTSSSDSENEFCISNTSFISNKDTSNSGHAIIYSSTSQATTKLVINENCHFLDNGDFTNNNHNGFAIVSNAPEFEFLDSKIEYSTIDESISAISLNTGSFVIINNIYFKHVQCNNNINSNTVGILIAAPLQKVDIDNCTFYHCGKNINNDYKRYAIKVLNRHSNINNCQFLNEDINNGIRSGSVSYEKGGNHTITCCTTKCSYVDGGAYKYKVSSSNDEIFFIFQNIYIGDSRGNPNYLTLDLYTQGAYIFDNITLEDSDGNIPRNFKNTFNLELHNNIEVEIKRLQLINIICQTTNNGGGGLWIRTYDNKQKLIFTDGFFKSNRADNTGDGNGIGGVFYFGLNDKLSKLDILLSNCSFIDNLADQRGGTLFISTDFSFTIDNCTFDSNKAIQKGGTIYLESAKTGDNIRHLLINNCKFINNTAASGSSFYFIPNDSNDICEITGGCEFINLQNGDNTIYAEYQTGIKISDSLFKNNEPSVTIRSIYLKGGNSNEISNCHFINGYSNGDGNALKTETSVLNLDIHDCEFINCGKGGHAINYLGTGCNIQHNIFTCSSASYNNGGIQINSNTAFTINNCSFIQDINSNGDSSNSILLDNEDFTFDGINRDQINAILISQNGQQTNQATITNCLFDGFTNGDSCFKLSLKTNNFIFDDNTIKNMVSTDHKGYFGYINGYSNINELTINRMHFINNVGKSLFGGGCPLLFYEINNLKFVGCYFTGNKAEQDSTISRPVPSADNHYYNGDGGAIQLGYLCPLNNINVKFDKCEFSKNSAYRHGGAIAIQTLGSVDIIGCTFTENTADNTTEKTDLLENHYDLKKEGRGGAIYINPNYDQYSLCQSSDLHMNSINIDGCTFTSNKAYDGYAMYIEGEEKENQETTFTIINNNFNNNYNLETLSKNYSIIATEICDPSLSYDTIVKSDKNNKFSNQKDGQQIYVLEVSCVDFYGRQVPSKIFSESYSFSYSAIFSKTTDFTNSKGFTETGKFSKSNVFSDSKKFSYSQYFTQSIGFSGTKQFTKSSAFTNSDKFSETSQFSKTDSFSASFYFTQSTGFSKSEAFSPSAGFNPTEVFSSSNAFSSSFYFTQSNNFSKSDDFTKSNIFPSTSEFTYSDMFSKSNDFSESNYFSKSFNFTKSNDFSHSSIFSQTNDFSRSDAFLKTDEFSRSKEFSKTIGFTKSSDFSHSSMFSASSDFTFSDKFSKSEIFTESSKFSNTGSFSSSLKFTNSVAFTKTEGFSNSDLFSSSSEFSNSNDFSKSNEFSISDMFSNTKEFSHTGYFSDSDTFSKSNDFTNSNLFTTSKEFSQSNSFSQSQAFSHSDNFNSTIVFSNSDKFSVSQSFTKSNEFSKSDDFSKSDEFTKSNAFSRSDMFSNTKEFSHTGYFSDSDAFSKSSEFTDSNLFTTSKEFSQSSQFSESGVFSRSDYFSDTTIFSKSNQFSNSQPYTKSTEFSNSNSFSKSNEFSQSTSFSNSKEFSHTGYFSDSDAFSKSSEFTNSNLFTTSKAFSQSNQFSESGAFSRSDYFSDTTIFSKSEQFSNSQPYTKSNEFSNSNNFSKSNEFSRSDMFSNTKEFSHTDYFSDSDAFSKSNEFTNSNLFTTSKEFSQSNSFSQSREFSHSDHFSLTGEFSNTDSFSYSSSFSKSLIFSNSNDFSESNDFSKSTLFSNSNEFSHTGHFSVSDKFSNSLKFSDTNLFTKSKEFSQSNQFSQSEHFSKTGIFSNTGHFSVSDKFSNSLKFSDTNLFTTSKEFSQSNQFSQSEHFSKTGIFSNTGYFSVSDQFSYSSVFTISDPFEPTLKFTVSKGFSNSGHFTETSFFSQTKEFLYTADFSKSKEFTISNTFVDSGVFTNSNHFSKTNYFSNTDHFTRTNDFSHTDHFSNTNDFSFSNKFTKSTDFSKSGEFSTTNIFSSTDYYTKSDIFSHSNKFSATKHFSFSDQFTETNKFTLTSKFSETNEFSKSITFTKSNQFSSSHDFTDSYQFTESYQFTPSITHEPRNPACIISNNNKNTTQNERCDYTSENGEKVEVTIISSNFTDCFEESDGAAIRVINCEIYCNGTYFVNCVSKNGGGGGIYVKNDYEMKNDIIFENLTFIQCEALYGGAIYIYSSYESNTILIRNCTFSYNMALGTKNSKIYGGSSIYMQAKNANVTECNFEHGKGVGGSFRISDIFDDNERRNKQLEETEKIISISGCNFEQEEKTNSIFYVNEKNSNRNEINIVDCKFKGKLSNGNHYIDGNVNVKDIPIFNIHSCEFEHEFKDSVKSELIKESAFNSFEKKPSFVLSSKRKFVFVILFVSTFSLMILFVMKYKLPNQSEADKSIYENADNSFEFEKGLV